MTSSWIGGFIFSQRWCHIRMESTWQRNIDLFLQPFQWCYQIRMVIDTYAKLTSDICNSGELKYRSSTNIRNWYDLVLTWCGIKRNNTWNQYSIRVRPNNIMLIIQSASISYKNLSAILNDVPKWSNEIVANHRKIDENQHCACWWRITVVCQVIYG